MTKTVIVHDYLTQRGGAERVVLAMLQAFPAAPIVTSLYEPDLTLPDFGRAEIRPSPLNRVRLFRRDHRRALPLLAPMFSSTHIDADVVICSSSGWAHGIKTDGRKIVYCHTPARWLYQSERYSQRLRPSERALLTVVKPVLLRWDRTAAQSADVYIANSTVVRDRIEAIYGITADVLPPPPVLDPLGESAAVPDAEPGFFLCVARLLPYKNVDAVLDAFASLPDDSLIVVGAGPERERLQATAPRNVRFLGLVDDRELRWLYTNCAALVAASYEDYGLTPLEAATFGRPAACLRWGGFLDTTREDVTAVFFSSPTGPAITDAIVRLKGMTWSEKAIRDNAHGFRTEVFCDRLRGYTTSLD